MQRRARRRLIGAIALVLFVVIALPMVFDREPRPITHDLAIRIPSQDTPFKPRLAPEPATTKAELPVAPEPPKPEQKTAEIAPAADPAQKPAEAKAQAKPVGVPKPAEAKAQPKPSFMVPLGAYSNAANAKQVRDKVAAAGYKTFAESVKSAKGEQLRVRAGPFASREDAEQARAKLKLLGLDPVGAVALREQP